MKATQHPRRLILLKGNERYIFILRRTRQDRALTLRALGRFASDPELSFAWYDAAVVSQWIRHAIPETKGCETCSKPCCGAGLWPRQSGTGF